MEIGLGNLPTNGPEMFAGSNKLFPLETHKSNKSNMFPVVVGSRSLSFSMPFRWFFFGCFCCALVRQRDRKISYVAFHSEVSRENGRCLTHGFLVINH